MIVVDEKGYEYRKWKGGSSFPIGVGVSDIGAYCNKAFECHWHEGIELLYVVEGELIHTVNGECFLMKEGDFMFVNSGSMHGGRATELGVAKYMVVSFLPSIISPEATGRVSEKYFGEVMSGKSFPLLYLEASDPNAQELCRLCNEVVRIIQGRGFCYELHVKALLFEIWAILFGYADSLDGVHKQDVLIDRVKKAVSYVNENYQNKISLDDMAACCNISKSEFCRSFKRVMNRTPFDFITDLRIRKSIELLEGGVSVTEAALSSGFFDSSYYTKTFKRYMGCTPREHMKSKNR